MPSQDRKATFLNLKFSKVAFLNGARRQRRPPGRLREVS